MSCQFPGYSGTQYGQAGAVAVTHSVVKVVLECVHEINLREACGECELELSDRTFGPGADRIIEPAAVLAAVARLEANQAPSSLSEALNSGDGSYRP